MLAAGIARRTFYKYFASKEDVLAAFYEVTTGELVRSIEDARRQSPSSLAGIHRGIDTYFDFHRSLPGLRTQGHPRAPRSNAGAWQQAA